ncbi:MAG TPA: proton-conducting transporter membrane subunit, partial [Oligoflexia bacterium]|nr:proton-conducting transporter membrane subunit [Oligoflexia bacterium]
MLNEIELLAQIIFLLPVAAFTVLALCHHRLPGHGDLTATSVLGTSLVLSVAVFLAALHAPDNILVNISFPWLAAGEASILSGGILVDKLTAVMLVVVTLVSFLVHLFSVKYMEGDARYGRYYCGLLLFTASMLGLVLANNMLYLFIFWELVGLSSYVLIGHWFEKKCAADAAIKAFITTRIGDIGMLIGILIC